MTEKTAQASSNADWEHLIRLQFGEPLAAPVTVATYDCEFRRGARAAGLSPWLAATRWRAAAAGSIRGPLASVLSFASLWAITQMLDRITHDPNVLAGRATLRGLRISVANVAAR